MASPLQAAILLTIPGHRGTLVPMINALRSALLVACFVTVALPDSAPARAETVVTTKKVIVRPGDSLGRIAERHKVNIDDLRRWNRRKIGKNDVIRLGDMLEIRVKTKRKGPPPSAADTKTEDKAKKASKDAPKLYKGRYTIRPGDHLGGIAKKLRVKTADLMRWNKLASITAIKAGATLYYERSGAPPKAYSVGLPADGRLVNGEHLGKGFGYRLRFPNGAYGMPKVNQMLRKCSAHVAKRFRGTAKILVGDISKPAGGAFPPHSSHQSGRDADLGYYLSGNKQNKTLHRVGAYQLDYAKNWAMLRCLLRTNQVVRVYMDTHIQKGYVAFMRKYKLASDATLVRLFGAVSDTPRLSLIRHSPGHDTHLHIRFACETHDKRCAEEPKDKLFKL